MLLRRVRREAQRIVARFTKTERREAKAEADKLRAQFAKVNAEIISLNTEIAKASPNCVPTLMRKLAMNFRASALTLERWASAIEKANED